MPRRRDRHGRRHDRADPRRLRPRPGPRCPPRRRTRRDAAAGRGTGRGVGRRRAGPRPPPRDRRRPDGDPPGRRRDGWRRSPRPRSSGSPTGRWSPYRQALLPLIDVAAWLRGEVESSGAARHENRASWQVVVHNHEGRRVGLVVDRVLDIVRQRLDVRGESRRPGVRQTAVRAGPGDRDPRRRRHPIHGRDRPAGSLSPWPRHLGSAPSRWATASTAWRSTASRRCSRHQEATRVPLAQPNIRGLINLRGQIVMAIDLRRCLGLEAAADGQPAMNLVLPTDDGPVSFLVDRVHDVVDVDAVGLRATRRRTCPDPSPGDDPRHRSHPRSTHPRPQRRCRSGDGRGSDPATEAIRHGKNHLSFPYNLM